MSASFQTSKIGDHDNEEIIADGIIEDLPTERDPALPKRIEKIEFDGSDYQTWKFRFTSLLLGIGMLDVVKGSPDDVKAKGYRSRCEYVYLMLVMSMTDKTIKFARTAPRGDARAIWDKLIAVKYY